MCRLTRPCKKREFLANDYETPKEASEFNTQHRISVQKTSMQPRKSGWRDGNPSKPGCNLPDWLSLHWKSGDHDSGCRRRGNAHRFSQKLGDYPMLPNAHRERNRDDRGRRLWSTSAIRYHVTISRQRNHRRRRACLVGSLIGTSAPFTSQGDYAGPPTTMPAGQAPAILLQNSSDIHLGGGILLKAMPRGFWTVHVL